MTLEKPQVMARYEKLRTLGRNLNNKLIKRVSREAIMESAKKLGIIEDGVLVFENEEEISILMDYCIYDFRADGRNAIDRYLVESPPSVGSDEYLLLKAMARSRFSLFQVEDIVQGLGVVVQDLLGRDAFLIVDINLSRTAPKGIVLAARIISPETFHMTSGAFLVVSRDVLLRLAEALSERFGKPLEDYARLSFEQNSELSALVIRTCLEGGASHQVVYEDLPTEMQDRGLPETREEPKIGRNAPCPCGSGKKYKKCCGRT